MARNQVKWTQELRKIVYARIAMEFGPHQSWGGTRAPKGKTKRFAQVLKELAEYLSRISGKPIGPGAIDQQIAWAVTKQSQVQNAGHARQFIMNKAAAVEMGFLTGPELPDYMLAHGGSQPTFAPVPLKASAPGR
jgi:hypothetical protein